MAAAIREDDDRIQNLLLSHKCKHVYLDVGSNIGVQVRKLYEPEKYNMSTVLSHFDNAFGKAPRCHVCAIGIEPNPRHRSRLATVTERLTAMGAGVAFIDAAAGTTDGIVDLQLGARKSPFEDAGASINGVGSFKGSHTFTVRQVRLSRIIALVRRRLAPSGRILMKLDVEGSEWTILPDLMVNGSLCSLHAVFAEFHEFAFAAASRARRKTDRIQSAGYRAMKRALVAAREELASSLSACFGTKIDTIDDESYVHDQKPFPTSSVC